jgi:hypothetical protein
MADTKISGLTEDTAPHRTNDMVPTFDASANTTKKVSLRNLGLYVLHGGCEEFSPADATVYYMGSLSHKAPNTTAAFRRIYVPRTGIITGCRIVVTAGGAGTAGVNSTFALRLNNTTDTTVSAVVTMASNFQTFENTGLTIAVTAGDYIEGKLTTGTWASNPTTVTVTFWAVVE